MKCKVLLLLFVSMNYGLVNAQTSIDVHLLDCRYRGNSEEYIGQLRLFKNNRLVLDYFPNKDKVLEWNMKMGLNNSWDDEIITLNENWEKNINIEPQDDGWEGVIIHGLKEGEYSIKYKSMFGRVEEKNIIVEDSKKNDVSLCFDDIDYENYLHTSTVENMINGDVYIIRQESRGCFHHTDESISIEKKLDGYYFKYNGTYGKLKNRSMNALNRLEIELDIVGSASFKGGCMSTTGDDYFITYLGETTKIADKSCGKIGWIHLINELSDK